MKNSILSSIVLSTLILLGACKGKDGDPGPKGDTGATGATGSTGLGYLTQSGFFKGTVSGNRTDGTAFSEAFDFEYIYSNTQEGFTQKNGVSYINFDRVNTSASNYLQIANLELINGNLQIDSTLTNYSYFLSFSKELSSTSVFELNIQPFFSFFKGYTVEISSDNNEKYYFETGRNPNNSSNRAIYYFSWYYNGSLTYGFYTYNYNTNLQFQVLYSATDGTLQAVIDNQNNITYTSGAQFDLYNKLTFKNNSNLGIPVFYDKATNVPLSAVIPNVPADQLIITNYKQDASTGVITFDFTLKVNQNRSVAGGSNTTKHDVTVTGSFNSGGKVYQSIVSRVAAGG